MRCNYCEWRCELSDSKYGICKMYHVQDGKIQERFPYHWSAYTVSHIESFPFYHAYPGSRSLAIGTVGCNFDCQYCSNAFIAKGEPDTLLEHLFYLTPEKLVRLALQTGCHNIVFNINEPTVSIPSLLDLSRVARREGLAMGCLTNGYTTEKATDLLASAFSFFNISLKSISSDFYRKYTRALSVEPILRNIERLAADSHVEVVTPVVPNVNDHELLEIARFLSSANPDMVWHVFRLLPEYKMKELRYPSIEALIPVLEEARQLLPYTYFHNFVGSDWVNTECTECGTVVIERLSLGCGGDRLVSFNCQGNNCPECGHRIPMLGGKIEWNREVV